MKRWNVLDWERGTSGGLLWLPMQIGSAALAATTAQRPVLSFI